MDNVQNSSQAYHSISVCCQATHWSGIWKSCQKEQLTQSNSLTAKITQIHILGILQNIISDVHILTENRSIHGHLPNYKEVQFYNINRRKCRLQCATALCTEGFFFLVVREPHSSVGSFTVEVSRSHTVLHITVSRNRLEEGSALCRDLYLITHITHKRSTSMPLVGFKHAMPASEQSQNYTWRPWLQIWHRKWTTCCKIWTYHHLPSEFLHIEQLVSCMQDNFIFQAKNCNLFNS